MKILLDEALPVQLRHHFVGHDARTVRYMGWLSAGNGELIALARDEFDVLVTCDKRMRREQNLTAEDVGMIVLNAVSSDMSHLTPLIPQTLAILPTVKRGQVVVVNP